jgi:translation elongation factor P/translation initiation factor 5A
MRVQAQELEIGDIIIAEGRKLKVAGIQQSHHNKGALLFSFRDDARHSEHLSTRSKIETFELINEKATR